MISAGVTALLSSPTLLIQSSIFAVGFNTSTERLTSFISPSPLSGTEWAQTNSYCIDGIGKYSRGQELRRETRDRSSGDKQDIPLNRERLLFPDQRFRQYEMRPGRDWRGQMGGGAHTGHRGRRHRTRKGTFGQ